MIARPHRSRMSIEEYVRRDRESTDERYEYIDGYAYLLAGGTANHSTICITITSLLFNRLNNSPCRVYNSDMKVRLAETRYVYPDASVSCDERDRGTVESLLFPRLIVEVLSPGTEAYDRSQKFDYYRECPTIEEYVLINAQRQAVDVYRRARKDLWHCFRTGDSVELTSLNVSFPLSTLYQHVLLPTDDTSDA